MTGSVTPTTLVLLLGSGAMLPLAAFFAARPDEEGKWRPSNIVSFIVGLLAILVLSFTLYQFR